MRAVLALTAVVGLFCLVAGPGCGIFGGADYWPMADGNLWQYRAVDVYVQPDSAPDTLIDEDYMKWKCGSQVTLDRGSKAWVMEMGDGDTAYFSESGNAVLWYDQLSDANGDTWLVLPLDEGKTWDFRGSTMLVREKGTVEVPAGTFKNCWKVQMLGSGGQLSLWHAPNVGLVLMEQSLGGPGHSFARRIELTDKIIK